MAHARITRVDVSAALAAPGRGRRVHRQPTSADDWAACRTAGRSATTSRRRRTSRSPQDKVRYVGDAVAVVVASDRYAAADALEAIEVDYEPLPAGARHGGRDGRRRRPGPRRPRHEPSLHLRRGTRRLRGREGQGRPSCSRRRYVNQRLIPMRDGAALGGRRPDRADGELYASGRRPRSRTSCASSCRSTTGIPEHKIRVIAPDVGGGFGSKLDSSTRGGDRLGRRARARPAGQVDRVAQRERPGDHPRPRPDPGRRARRTNDGRMLGLRVDLLAEHGRATCMLLTPGIPLLGRVHVPRHLQVRGTTTSPARACSPPRRRPTPTAAPAARRRRSPSSG